MSRTFVIVMGLPGSGKSHYVRSLGIPYQDDWMNDFKSLEGSLLDAPVLALADPRFIEKWFRELFDYNLTHWFPGCVIKYVAFENDPDQCSINVLTRMANGDTRRMYRWSIYDRSERYTIPDGAEVIPVWKEEVPVL